MTYRSGYTFPQSKPSSSVTWYHKHSRTVNSATPSTITTSSEYTPPSLPSPFILPPLRPFLPRLQLPKRLHLLQHMLQALLPPHQIQMPPNLRIFSCESLDSRIVQSSELLFQPSRKLIVELAQELRIEEEIGGGSKLIRHSVQEDFGAMILVLRIRALT